MTVPDLGPLSKEEALEFMLTRWRPTGGSEWVQLSEALGRVTAQTLRSRHTLPTHRVSGADGIAVKAAAFAGGTPDVSRWIPGVDYAPADTGDDFPDQFDTVVTVESLVRDQDGGLIGLAEGFEFVPGGAVRPAGHLVQTGDLLVPAHTRLGPTHLAVLALGGVVELNVVRRPRVAYIPTGDELIPAGLKPGRGQHLETNGHLVRATLEQWGAQAVNYPIIRDDLADLNEALDAALASSDIVLINGGSSKGAEDFNADLLRRRATDYAHGIKMRPGKPVAIALIDGKIAINLPGPPFATWLALDWCVAALVHRFLNLPAPQRPRLKVKLARDVEKGADWAMFLRLVLEPDGAGGFWATPVAREARSPESLLAPDAAYVAPIGLTRIPAGAEVEAELIGGWESLDGSL
jgi:molybdopterin molybdotransferase/putative molybdopterin biosynthesis protein